MQVYTSPKIPIMKEETTQCNFDVSLTTPIGPVLDKESLWRS